MRLAIITPIGPGHKDDYSACLKSIKTAWAHNQGKFEGIEIIPMWDLEGKYGRSDRRNCGIDQALERKCDWLFFLDADDLMSQFAFEDVSNYLDNYDAVWGNICEAPYGKFALKQRRKGQLHATQQFDDILKIDPHNTLQIGHFIRTACASEVRFDTSMDTGEDFRYYLKICERFRFVKVPAVFFIKQLGHHSTGPRFADAIHWGKVVQCEIQDVIARRGLIAEISLEQSTSKFSITNPFDFIQKHHCRGIFFEQSELLSLKTIVGPNKIIVEVGANIGNHVVFYAKHMSAQRIYPFEPNPESVAILRQNISLNTLHDVVDDRGIGLGVGKQRGWHSVHLPRENNLGAARLVEGGEIEVVTLDDTMSGVNVDFIKIDVEGMEFDVLKGSERLIKECRPLIYIEVWNNSIPRLEEWVQNNEYKILGAARYVNGINFLIGPR
jgi:FkbM family methyltransferase